MSTEPDNSQNSFVPPNIILSEEWEEASLTLTDYLIKIAEAINTREIAQYQDATIDADGDNISSITTGETWFTPSDPTKFRYGSRTVINFGALPNNATKTAAHGINVTNNTIFTNIYGTASVPGTTFIPIPYSNTAGNHVEIWVDAGNINVRTISDYSTYTQCYIIVEWIESVT